MNQNRSLKYDRKEREKTTMYDIKLCEGAGKRIRLRATTCLFILFYIYLSQSPELSGLIKH